MPAHTLMTVRGPVAVEGPILPAEHVHADLRSRTAPDGPLRAAPLTIDILGAVALGAANLENLDLTDEDLAARELVGFDGAIVDATPPDLGRDPAALARIATATGVPIVMGSGRYAATGEDADTLTAEIVRDLEQGVDGIRAGVIGRLGPLDPADGHDAALLVAAARASARTGAPVLITHPGEARIDAVLRALRDGGASPGRIAVLGCSGRAGLDAIADAGACVVFDRIGRLTSANSTWDDEDVASAIAALAAAGHGDRILLSPGIAERIDLAAYGGSGYGMLPAYAGYLGWHGVAPETSALITTVNPARFLTGADA